MRRVIKVSDVKGYEAPAPHTRILKYLIEKDTVDAKNLVLGVGILEPRRKGDVHCHDCEEVFYIVRGHGHMTIDEEEYEVKSDTAIYIAPMSPHAISNSGEEDLFYIFVLSPHPEVLRAKAQLWRKVG